MLNYLLFEALWVPATLAAGGFLALLFIGRNMEPARRGKLWLAWLIGVVGLFILQKAVTTDREAVRERLGALIRAVCVKDAERIDACIAPDYREAGRDKAAVLTWITNTLKSVDVYDVYVTRCEIQIDGDAATMELTAFGGLRLQGSDLGRHTAAWTIRWQRTPLGWAMTALIPRALDTQPVRRLEDLR